MATIQFNTKLVKADDSSATAIYIPDKLVHQLSDKKRIPVHVTIDNVSYQSTIVVMAKRFLLPVNKSIRNKIKKTGGEVVLVEISNDHSKREITLTPLLETVLAKVNLISTFRSLSYTQQKEYVNWISDAKKNETRERRLIKLVSELKQL